MKKLFAVLLSALVVSAGAVTAFADETAATLDAAEAPTAVAADVQVKSPTVSDPNGNIKPNDGNGSNTGDDDDANKNKNNSSTSSNTSSNTGSNTSPKTGAPVAEGAFLAVAALAFAGVAVSSKKKS